MKKALLLFAFSGVLAGCVAPSLPDRPSQPACAMPDPEETDGGIGGTGHSDCPEEATE